MTQSNFTGRVHSFFVDDPIYFKKIRLMFCRIEYFYMFINNPELIDISNPIYTFWEVINQIDLS